MPRWTPTQRALRLITARSLDPPTGWTGLITVTIRREDGSYAIRRFHNIITHGALDLVAGLLRGTVTDGRVKYVAIGDSSTAVADTQTKLVNEMYRMAVSSYTQPGTGQLSTSVSVPAPDATSFTTNEIGWFAGSTATATKDSGVMIARVLYSHAKTALEVMQIDRTDTWSN